MKCKKLIPKTLIQIQETGSEIIFSKETYTHLNDAEKDLVEIESLLPVRIKGKHLPVECFSVK